VCKRLREMHDKAVATFEARGGDKSKYDHGKNDSKNWYFAVPGLANEVALLAWKHRSESPIVVVTTSPIFDAKGVATQVSVLPRSFWDEDPRFTETFCEDMRESIRMNIDGANFSPDTHYVVVIDIKHSVPQRMNIISVVYGSNVQRAVEIVDALTSAATTPEDLAAAIAWFKDKCLTQDQFRPITENFERQAAAHGSSRALHNQVAYFIIQSRGLEFCVRLVGLRGATHLNGRAGVIRGTGLNRFRVRLDDDGKEVSVKAENFEHIRGDDYKRRAL
jgi:hypothetical protein